MLLYPDLHYQYGSGFRSRRPKYMRIRIHNTAWNQQIWKNPDPQLNDPDLAVEDLNAELPPA
jgi:hypothetical protein